MCFEEVRTAVVEFWKLRLVYAWRANTAQPLAGRAEYMSNPTTQPANLSAS